MPVYKFSHYLLAVLVHLAYTVVKWKTNFLILDVGDKLVNTDDTALIKYEKKFMSPWESSSVVATAWKMSTEASATYGNRLKSEYQRATQSGVP